MQNANDVDEYIASAPSSFQIKLKELRTAIKSAAPQAEEKMSYGMPYYSYKGRLIYFGFAKNHIGVYPMPPITDLYAKELRKYQTGKATIRFPLDKELPLELVKKLVRARVKMNEEAKL